MMERVGFVGFGEAASAFAQGLRAGGVGALWAYEPAQHGPFADVYARRAEAAQVTLVDDPAPLAQAEVVVSAVTPEQAVAAARTVAPSLVAGQLYVDVNSCTPAMKREAARLVEARGARYVDVGMAGSIKLDGHRLPVYAAGPHAQEFADRFSPYGFRIRVLPGAIGQAAALKMIRGVVMKGMEALLVEMLLAAERAQIADAVLESVANAYDATTFRDHANMLLTTHAIHAARRLDEVRMIRDTIRELGVEPLATEGTERRFAEDVRHDLKSHFGNEVPAGWQQVVETLLSRGAR
jgi:3-hydroxyisobutyrate dehydrogenase-like beta-hydroxyacid dehydrogenase